ncbi:MAG: hypothetical protein IKH28_11570 [Lachnospiraceae bacterium]|nr:hypothetical protein [Lachnospiraceae bacterium]
MVDGAVLQLMEAQEEIIRLQADAIHELFMALAQYMCAEELDAMPAVKKINRAAELKAENSL